MSGQIFFSRGKSNFCGVFLAFFGRKWVNITKEISDNSGRILLQIKIDDEIYLLANLCNSNTEPEQLETLHELETILLKSDANEYNHMIFSGDFNIFLNASLEATTFLTRTVGKFLELKDKFDLCDISRIKHPKTKNFTFRQKHFFWFYPAEIGLHFCFAKSSGKNKK